MAAWDCNDDLFDRQEALGQQRETEGESPTEGFYGDWLQEERVAAELHRLLVEPLDEIVAMFEDAA